MTNFMRLVKVLCFSVVALLVSFVAFVFFVFTHDYIDQTDGPITREQALANHCPIDLPTSAHHVQYSCLAGGLQDCEQYVRFEAPVSECYKTAKDYFAKHSDTTQKSDENIPPFAPTSHPDPQRSGRLRTEWFDVEKISKGVVAIRNRMGGPTIWIDEERGVFYFYFID